MIYTNYLNSEVLHANDMTLYYGRNIQHGLNYPENTSISAAIKNWIHLHVLIVVLFLK